MPRPRPHDGEVPVNDGVPRAPPRREARASHNISLPLDDRETRLEYEVRSPTEDGNSSVQKLLVLSAPTPGPADVRARVSAWWSRRRRASWTWGQPEWAKMAAKVKTHSDNWRQNYQLPYLILLLGVVQVALQSSPLCPLSSQLMWAGRGAGLVEPWRFVSYVLPHTGVAHLVLNVVVQTLVGVPAECSQGAARVGGVYVGGALAGALATAVLCPALQMAGSSAAIYAVLTAHLADVFLNKEWIGHPGARAGAVVVLAAADAAYTVHHLFYGNLKPRISVAAHAAGAASGLPLGLAMYRRGPQKAAPPGLPMAVSPSAGRERVVVVARVASALVLGACAAAGVAFLVAVPGPSAVALGTYGSCS